MMRHMPLPMMGTRTATLLSVSAFSIHGQMNYQISFHLDGEPNESVWEGRVAKEAAFENVRSGDRATLHFLMGNVVKVDPA
jgi:hypothetical protein